MSSAPWDYIAKLVCIGDSGCGKSSLTIRLCEGRFIAHHDVTIGVEFGSRVVPVGPPYSNDAATLQHSSSRRRQNADDETTTSSANHTNDNGNPTDPTDTSTGTSTGAGKQGLPPPPVTPRAGGEQPQKHMKLSLWDTAGQETYKSVTRSYFRGASGALLVFDLTRRSTFQHVTDWLNDLRQIAEPDIVVVLVGNKADLASPRAGEDEEEEEDGGEEGNDAGGSGGGGGSGGHQGKPQVKRKGGNKREVTRQEAEEWARRNGILEYIETSAKSGENVEKAFMRVAERIYQNIQAGKYDLNDRRSGVKGPSAGGVRTGSKPVRLTSDAGKGLAGGCC